MMQIRAKERLTLMDTGAVIQPGGLVQIEDNRAQILISCGAAEAVSAVQPVPTAASPEPAPDFTPENTEGHPAAAVHEES